MLETEADGKDDGWMAGKEFAIDDFAIRHLSPPNQIPAKCTRAKKRMMTRSASRFMHDGPLIRYFHIFADQEGCFEVGVCFVQDQAPAHPQAMQAVRTIRFDRILLWLTILTITASNWVETSDRRVPPLLSKHLAHMRTVWTVFSASLGFGQLSLLWTRRIINFFRDIQLKM